MLIFVQVHSPCLEDETLPGRDDTQCYPRYMCFYSVGSLSKLYSNSFVLSEGSDGFIIHCCVLSCASRLSKSLFVHIADVLVSAKLCRIVVCNLGLVLFATKQFCQQ